MNSIIISHFLFHGRFLETKYNNYTKYTIIWSLYCFNQWHVDAFGLISGIVDCKKNSDILIYFIYGFILFLIHFLSLQFINFYIRKQ